MFRALTPKNQVKLVSEFVQAAGGTAKHTAVCEVVAKLWGAPNWNVFTGAQKNVAEQQPQFTEEQLYLMVQENLSLMESLIDKAKTAKYLADEIPFHWESVYLSSSCYMVPEDSEIAISFEQNGSQRMLTDDEFQYIADQGIAVSMDLNYPNSDKYGTPDEAGDRGGREYVWEELGFKTSRDFEVNGNDTGDDSGMHYVLEVAIPPELHAKLSSVPRDSSCCTGCGSSLDGRSNWQGLCYDCALDEGLVDNHVPGERNLPDDEKSTSGN